MEFALEHCLYLLALLRRRLLYIVVLALICWPRWVDGVDQNWMFSDEISFLLDLRYWSCHLRADFCFLVGGGGGGLSCEI